MSSPPRLNAPPLDSAVCELRFPRPATQITAQSVAGLQKALVSEYPRFEEQTGFEVRATTHGLATVESPAFRFSSPSGVWHVQLTQSFFSLETTAYEDIRVFVDRWHWVASRVKEQLALEWRERLGTRYVNRLPIHADDGLASMVGVLRETLLATIGSHPRTQRLVGSMHEERFQQDDGVITIRHGLQVPPRELAQPSFYLLDFDYYNEAVERLDLDECAAMITSFNAGVYELLEDWAITHEHFRTFQPEGVT